MVLHTVGDGKYLLTAAEKMNWMSFYYLGIAEKSTWCIKLLTSSFICLTSVQSQNLPTSHSPDLRCLVPTLPFVQNTHSTSNGQVLGSQHLSSIFNSFCGFNDSNAALSLILTFHALCWWCTCLWFRLWILNIWFPSIDKEPTGAILSSHNKYMLKQSSHCL